MGETPIASSEARTIATIDVGAPTDVLRIAPDRWPRVLSELVFQRLTGIAVAGWESGRLEPRPEQLHELLERHRSAMVLALRIEQQLLSVSERFEAVGLRAVVLKGCAVARSLYPDPSMRPYGDLDLLVASADWRRACEVLRELGYRRILPEPRPGFDERFGKAATHVSDDGYQVDLHRTLVVGPFGRWLDPGALLRSTERFEVGGRSVERLDPTGMLLNAALHAGLGASPPLLLPMRDVLQAVRDPRIDWDRLERWTSLWRLGAAMQLAFSSVERELGVELPPVARPIASRPLGRRDLRQIRGYTERRRVGGLELGTIRSIRGLRAKGAFVVGLMLPSREFLDARAGGHGRASYVSRWRRAIRKLTRRPRRHLRDHRPRKGEMVR